MLSSIGKFSKSLSLRILVGIIILPFVFWGMGDIFRGGNQNIIAKIDSEKINTKEFVNYLNRVNLTEKERKNLTNSDLLERIVSLFDEVQSVPQTGGKLIPSPNQAIIKQDLQKILSNKHKVEGN